MRHEELLFAVGMVCGVLYLLFSPIAAQQADYYRVWQLEHTQEAVRAANLANYDAMRLSLASVNADLFSCETKLNSAFGGLNLFLIIMMFTCGFMLGALFLWLWNDSHKKSIMQLWYEIPYSERAKFGFEQVAREKKGR